MLLFALLACGVRDDTRSPDPGDTTADECTGLPALSPAPDGFEPVLGEGALVVFGEICDPSVDPEFTWTVEHAPDGYTDDDLVTYQDHDHAEALLNASAEGTYVVGVVVADPGGDTSEPDWFAVSVSPGDPLPIADCGDDREARVGESVSLDGTRSYDPLGEALVYAWTVDAVPTGSSVAEDAFDDATSATPSFVPDAVGAFTVTLRVGDGETWSEPDSCVVTVR